MKTHALAKNVISNKETEVTAFDAICLREFSYNEFKNYKFFYVDSTNKFYEMCPKFIKATNTAFFAFKSENERPKEIVCDEGESLTHFAAKKALLELSALHLIERSKHYYFYTDKKHSCNEKRFVFDKCFYADVYYKLDKNNQKQEMKKYIYKWYENLVIEVCVSHKVSPEKYTAFQNNNIPIFEVTIPESTYTKFELDNKTELSKEKIIKAIDNMKRMFKKGIRGKFISNPSSEEYLVMCRYKEEIKKFIDAKNDKENEYNETLKKTEKAKSELLEIESKIQYYNSLEEQIKKLNMENKKLQEVINDSKKHPFKFLMSKRKEK